MSSALTPGGSVHSPGCQDDQEHDQELNKREARLLKRIKAPTDEVEALKISMDIEMESIRVYENLLHETDTPGQKEIICSLLKEEQHRYTTFGNTCLFLSDPASWFL